MSQLLWFKKQNSMPSGAPLPKQRKRAVAVAVAVAVSPVLGEKEKEGKTHSRQPNIHPGIYYTQTVACIQGVRL